MPAMTQEKIESNLRDIEVLLDSVERAVDADDPEALQGVPEALEHAGKLLAEIRQSL
jgi:hypothetical protein